VVSKKSWDLLPAEYQKVVRDVSAKWHRILIHKVRKDNKKAEKALLKLGYQFVTPSPSAQREWNSLGLQVTKSLVGKVYSKDILVQVARLLKSAK
jgi:TRAP-type C4-dicarboxylate transport system substrate-binding protein